MNWNWWPLVWRSTYDGLIEKVIDSNRWHDRKDREIAVLKSKLNKAEVELADLRDAVRRMAP